MKAIIYEEYGTPDKLTLRDVPQPAPKDDEVLVRVHAVSINSWDWDKLRGKPLIARMGGWRRPKHRTLGCDIAGVLEAAGRGVTTFREGDEVYGDLSHAGWGGFAEYVCAPTQWLQRKSPAMTFAEAAALPQAGVLAIQGLRDNRQLRRGERLLINGAGGGVGTFAIQIAKSIGAEVTAVDKASKLETLRALGADHVVDYTKEDFTTSGETYDLILDMVVSRRHAEYRRALNVGGAVVMVGGEIHLVALLLLGLLRKSRRVTLLMHKPNAADLQGLNEHYENGTARPIIDRTFSLERTADAFRYFGRNEFVGKVVVTVR